MPIKGKRMPEIRFYRANLRHYSSGKLVQTNRRLD